MSTPNPKINEAVGREEEDEEKLGSYSNDEGLC